ncbi:MAG: Uncharacterized protein G01um10147_727 [Microgenomates group bacterium Gr01-1014_7]|nr:MAG: Uncharacterized protein G01um10147_727 [Microgenomates group bacterium Gr01-1014_7]
MILWIVLFIVIVAISFLLALRSMKDYQEIPSESQYALFLIRNPKALNSRILTNLAEDFLKRNLILSFERLFKGNKSTLLIFGPKLLADLYDMLDLLELEDYTDVSSDRISAWEVGIKEGKGESLDYARDKRVKGKGVFVNFPQLNESEHFWWQVLISRAFKPQIRAIVVSDSQSRRKQLLEELEKLAPHKLYKLPKVFSDSQILEFYKNRSYAVANENPHLTPDEILSLIKI